MPDQSRGIALAIAARQRGGVFTVDDVQRAGFSRGQLRGRVQAGHWCRLRTGVFALAGVVRTADARETHRLRTAAALAVTTNTWASTTSAGVVHGLEMLREPPLDVIRLARAATGPGRARRSADLQIRTCGLPPEHRTVVRGVRTTTAARTAVDLARELPILTGVVAVDSAMRRRGVTVSALDAVLSQLAGWPGTARAASAIQLADPKAESVLESVSRVELITRGLPPETQCWLAGPGGAARTDFLWWRRRTIGEADGLAKYEKYGASDRDPLVLEKWRHQMLDDWGFEVVRWTWAEIRRDPDAVADRVRRAFARSGLRQEIRARNGEPDLVRRLAAAPWDLPRVI